MSLINQLKDQPEETQDRFRKFYLDTYRSGQGMKVLEFLRNPDNIRNLRKALPVRILTGDEADKIVKDATGATDNWLTVEQAERMPAHLSRDTGSKILGLIANGKANEVLLSLDFENDDLFCEGVYEVNLDDNTFKREDHDGCDVYDLENLPTDNEFQFPRSDNMIDPVRPEDAVTTDAEDSFAVFRVNGLFLVRPVFPDGRVGATISVYEREAEAEVLRDELIEHLGAWSEIAWKEFANV